MKRAAVIIMLLALAGCAPDAATGTQQVELDGQVRSFTSEVGEFGYKLEVPGQGLLPLDVGDAEPPLHTSGVVVEVPASLEIPDDQAARFAVLDEYVDDTGEPLMVIDFVDAVAGTQRVEVSGTLRTMAASGSDGGYLLETPDGLLPLDLAGLRPPVRVTGVVVEVPGALAIPDDATGVFEVLNGHVGSTGESLRVVDFLV